MESRLIAEQELRDITITIPSEGRLFYWKLVNIGPNTLNEHQGKLPDLMQNIPGFFIAADAKEIPGILHNYISNICKEVGLNES